MNNLRAKLCLFVLACTAFSTFILAESISSSQAQKIACNFLQSSSPLHYSNTKIGNDLTVLWSSDQLFKKEDTTLKTTNSSKNDPTFYLFSRLGQKGFVLVSGEDTTYPILGYSFENEAFTADEIPENMLAYLQSLDEQIQTIRKEKALNSPTQQSLNDESAQPGLPIVELHTAIWGQYEPFNGQCPMSGNRQCITGCIPTAFSILMKYHQWPEKGTGILPEYLSGPEALRVPERDLSKHTYAWNQMPDSYNDGYTPEQGNAVATLMADLGHLFQVEYGLGATSGYHTQTSFNLFKQHFSYHASGERIQKDILCDDVEWVNLIKNDLKASRPIAYAATSTSSQGSPHMKHIFILDGFTDNNYFHFNWGWNGSSNGYYLLTTMNPTPNQNYVKSHIAYFKVRPDKDIQQITVTAKASEGGKAMVNGEPNVTVNKGSNVTLISQPTEGYIFSHWTRNTETVSKEMVLTVKATENAEYVAHFTKIENEQIFTIKVDKEGQGNVYIGNASTTTSIRLKGGEQTIIHAVADNGYSFSHWSSLGQEVSTEADFTVTATSNTTYTAHFKEISQTNKVSISVESGGNGITYIGDDTSVQFIEVEQNSRVTIHAVGNTGYKFSYWARMYGGMEVTLDGLKGHCEIAADRDKELIAYFERGEETGITQSGISQVLVYADAERIYIQNYKGTAQVFTMTGQLIRNINIEGNTQIELNKGIYLIATGNILTKIAVK